MATKPQEPEVPKEQVEEPHVTLHLDVDPNDPRNRLATPKLPSLNDEDQQ